jgi:hypothetical protein
MVEQKLSEICNEVMKTVQGRFPKATVTVEGSYVEIRFRRDHNKCDISISATNNYVEINVLNPGYIGKVYSLQDVLKESMGYGNNISKVLHQ